MTPNIKLSALSSLIYRFSISPDRICCGTAGLILHFIKKGNIPPVMPANLQNKDLLFNIKLYLNCSNKGNSIME